MILEEVTTLKKVPDFELADKVYLATLGESNETLTNEIVGEIVKNEMAPYLYHLYYDLHLKGLEWDQGVYDGLVTANEKKVGALKEEIAKLDEEDESEMDILKKWTELGEYYANIGDKENAVETLKKTIELAPSTGSKIDLFLTISRIGYFFNDQIFIKKYLDEANDLIEKGGDWERRNRYKTYLGIYYMSTRNFVDASKLLTESLSTFTSTELTTYESVAQYALLSSALVLPRPELKKKLLESPEILSINSQSGELLPIFNLIQSLHSTEYKSFFPYLLETYDKILTKNKYLAPHANYYIREIRVRAYSQLLESYRSLSLKSMAESFGVSPAFLDDDLCKFILTKKVNCVIDRVNGIIETNRADNKNIQYDSLIKTGDALLTKLQKYGAAVRLSGAEKV